MHRLLCLIGIHHWRVTLMRPFWEEALERVCKRCGKVQVSPTGLLWFNVRSAPPETRIRNRRMRAARK